MAEWDILTKDDIKIIQESYNKISGRHQETGDFLYGHLFEANPELKEIFKSDMNEQAQTLMRMVKTIVEGLNNPQILMPAVQEMGMRHVDYGVKPEHYESFKKSMVFSLKKVIGNDYNNDVEKSWNKLYDILADIMKR